MILNDSFSYLHVIIWMRLGARSVKGQYEVAAAGTLHKHTMATLCLLFIQDRLNK